MRRYPWDQGPRRDPFDFEDYDFRIPRPPRRVWVGLALLGIAFLVFVLGSPLVTFLTDLSWYRALGLESVYVTRLRLQSTLFAGSLLISFVYLYANGRLALAGGAPRALRAVGVAAPSRRIQNAIAAIGAAILALLFSLGAGSSWQTLALMNGAVDTGVRDPLFNLDIAFYLLRLPFYEALLTWAIALAFVGLLYAAAFHAWRTGGFDGVISGRALAHVSVLLAILALVLGLRRWFDRYDLVFSHNGVVWGAGYTDVNARVPMAVLGAGAAVLIALFLVANVRLRRPSFIAGAVGAWVLVAILGSVYPSAVERLHVIPAQGSVEQPYIQRQIDATRAAYGLSGVGTQAFGGAAPLSQSAVAADQSTIDNLRLWDDRQLNDTYNHLQTIRTYYTFPNVDLDRYTIGGKYEQVEVGAREVDVSRLTGQAQTWVNQKLKYTHGYGMAASPVSAVKGEGLPDYVVGDLPPAGPLSIEQPAVYFGEQTNDYVIAPSQTKEFDYPQAGTDVYTTYSGNRGVRLDAVQRALWSLRTGDFNLLISDQVTDRSQILFRRQLTDRLTEIAPFLSFDGDPYIVDADGHLYWIVDGYTTASTYPYSEQEDQTFGSLQQGTNYVRNSVKAVVNAYDGSVQLYVATPHDPIIQAYEKTFPALFKPLTDMPASLLTHVRVPSDMFTMQADIYRTYHVTDPNVFYQREDVWDFATEQPSPDQAPQPLSPYYVMMRLPDEKSAEYLLILPFTPYRKTNMVSWLAVRNDPPHYGEMVSYVLPKDRVTFGPQQVSQRILEQQAISRDFTLFNGQNGGSRVIQGNLIVVPIGGTFLYVEPVYLQASGTGSLVELRKVILVDADTVAYADDLQTALAQLVGQAPPPTKPGGPPPAGGTTLADLVKQFDQHYQAAIAALKTGDLAGYASEMQQADKIAQQIAAQGGSPSPSPGPSP